MAEPTPANEVERTLSQRSKMYDVDGDGKLGALEQVSSSAPRVGSTA